MSDAYVIDIPAKSKDLTGRKFCMLTVINYTGKQAKNGNLKWECLCECGKVTIVTGGHLTDGSTKSCGCFIKQITSQRSIKHGHTKNNHISSTYSSWQAMIARCSRPGINDYQYYGGRGIKVCERWNKFSFFMEDMGERPKGYQLDRIDYDGNYEPSNCRWVTIKQQARNKRNNNRLSFGGKIQTIVEWSEEIGVPEDTLWHRIYTAKWPINKALTKPLRKRIDNRVNLSQ